MIGSQTASYDPRPRSTDATADESVEAARTVTVLCGLGVRANPRRVEHGVDGPRQPRLPSDAADAIVAEAMRTDTDVPLWIACGGGLTNLASALLIEPAIAGRLTALWIGGQEHPGLAEPERGPLAVEYNTSIDVLAAQVVFDDPTLPMWQVPCDAYRQVLASLSEMLHRMRPCGPLGTHLYEALAVNTDAMKWVRPQHG